MSAIFLSASVPIEGRGDYYETANPFLIQCAVRELVISVIRNHKIVWGGHPAITPMIWAICQDLDVNYSQSVILYQSKFFEDIYPEENEHFNNVIYTPAVPNNREKSLLHMRESIFSRTDLSAAVFIGGMEGVEEEYRLFERFKPNVKVVFVPAAGGAALELAKKTGQFKEQELTDVNFARLFNVKLE